MKLSHTSLSKFQTCAKSWQLRYHYRLVGENKGSALFFGSAMDAALTYLLENKDNKDTDIINEALRIFSINWEQGKDHNGEIIDLPLNPNILYSKWDFDADLFDKADWSSIFSKYKNPFTTMDFVKDALKDTEWNDIPEDQRSIYNYMHWMSLKKKAKYLIEAYARDILPQIDRVIATQMEVSYQDQYGNILSGFIDALVSLKDGRIAVADNKTSSMDYENDSVFTSPQLALYKALLDIRASNPEDKWEIFPDVAAFFVVSKKLDKNMKKVCSSCGHTAEDGARHKTCNAEIDGKRCGGEWTVTKDIKATTQTILSEIDPRTIDLVLMNAETIIKAIAHDIFPRNLNACHGKFGRCEYYNLCWYGKKDGIVELKTKLETTQNGKIT